MGNLALEKENNGDAEERKGIILSASVRRQEEPGYSAEVEVLV